MPGSTQQITYTIRVYGQGRDVAKSFSPHVPRHLTEEDADDTEAKELFQQLLYRFYGCLVCDHGPSKCAICSKAPQTLRQHSVRQPHNQATAIVVPHCSHKRCQIGAMQLRSEVAAQFVQSGPDGYYETLHFCNVCGKADNVKACSRCKVASYCSLNCQKLDWPKHRKMCKIKTQA